MDRFWIELTQNLKAEVHATTTTIKMSAPMEQKTKDGGDKKKEDDAELDALLDSKIHYSRIFSTEILVRIVTLVINISLT